MLALPSVPGTLAPDPFWIKGPYSEVPFALCVSHTELHPRDLTVACLLPGPRIVPLSDMDSSQSWPGLAD